MSLASKNEKKGMVPTGTSNQETYSSSRLGLTKIIFVNHSVRLLRKLNRKSWLIYENRSNFCIILKFKEHT